ncbi:MFS general substrate transporter [Macrolepiota fuliginosa MF-IS2]|uniref:MFS general substrate transporter n=1 Tax=Macrolepiota fuliginosa MF-IS2 TaxID=1400762 RepID=A0A9P6C7A1_9AGAR|nr:MFS general substrate transporter [Macrolepiota fuliginosa MF-IS2]
MENVGGYRAWRWVFFIEGAISFVIAIPAFFILPDFPDSPSSGKWLGPELLQVARQRKLEEVGGLAEIPDVSQKEGFMLAVKDWKVWWLALCVAAYQLSQGYHQYFPTIVQTLGYNNTITLVLCAPPGFASALFTFVLARHSDRVHMRFPHIALSLGISLIGWVMAMSTMNVAVRYASIFLMDAIPGGFVVILAWVSNTITAPPAKKAVAIGLIVAFSQLGSFAGSYIFPARWGPQYTISFGISIAAAGVTILMCFVLRLHLGSENKKSERARKENPELRPYKYLL